MKQFFKSTRFFFLACLFLQLLTVPTSWAYPWLNNLLEDQPNRAQVTATGFYYENKKPKKFYFQMGSDFSFHNQKIDLDLGIDYLFYERRLYVRPSELAVFFPLFSSKWKMGLGMNKYLWSLTDSYWNHGLWQPRYKLDVFRPQIMGLSGLYFEYEGEDISWILLASYFHVPDISTSPRRPKKSNRLESKNPFFDQASADQFKWHFDEKSLHNIENLFHPVLAFQIKHSMEKAHFALSYAYKPANRFRRFFLVGALSPEKPPEIRQDLSTTETIDLSKLGSVSTEASEEAREKGQKIIAAYSQAAQDSLRSIKDFKIFLFPHHVAGLEGQADIGGGLSLSASLMYEKPVEGKGLSGDGWQSLKPESKLIASLLSYFKEKGETYETLLSFGWTKIKQSSESNRVEADMESAFGMGFYVERSSFCRS